MSNCPMCGQPTDDVPGGCCVPPCTERATDILTQRTLTHEYGWSGAVCPGHAAKISDKCAERGLRCRVEPLARREARVG